MGDATDDILERLRSDIRAHEITGNGGMRRVATLREAATLITSLREDIELREDLLIKAEKLRFGADLTVESRGVSQWAVCQPGEVLNASGEWEWEPQPSSRTDEFIARTRFTFAKAVTLAREITNPSRKETI